MSWDIYEKAEDKDGVKEWSLFILMNGEQHSKTAGPFRKGYWFFGIADGDAAGHRLHKNGLKEAKAEVERLKQQFSEPSHQ